MQKHFSAVYVFFQRSMPIVSARGFDSARTWHDLALFSLLDSNFDLTRLKNCDLTCLKISGLTWLDSNKKKIDLTRLKISDLTWLEKKNLLDSNQNTIRVIPQIPGFSNKPDSLDDWRGWLFFTALRFQEWSCYGMENEWRSLNYIKKHAKVN